MICAEQTAVPELQRDGFFLLSGTVDSTAVDRAAQALEEFQTLASAKRHAGFRDALSIPALASLAEAAELRRIASALLSTEAFVARALLFDKNASANWTASWHQDLTISVRARVDVPGFGPWSVKEGIPHVQPPSAVLERMITLRLHLDDCDQNNGALRVIPGSHLHGKLDAADVESWRNTTPERLCAAARGDVLAMRPLLLHASSAAAQPRHRRVLHLEFAAGELPGGLQWHAGGCEPVVAPNATGS